jgi:hypothetical protein
VVVMACNIATSRAREGSADCLVNNGPDASA